MVSPATRREWVRWARDAYQLSERRASRATGVALSTIQYKSRRSPRAPLRARLRELAASRVSFGYPRLPRNEEKADGDRYVGRRPRDTHLNPLIRRAFFRSTSRLTIAVSMIETAARGLHTSDDSLSHSLEGR